MSPEKQEFPLKNVYKSNTSHQSSISDYVTSKIEPSQRAQPDIEEQPFVEEDSETSVSQVEDSLLTIQNEENQGGHP